MKRRMKKVARVYDFSVLFQPMEEGGYLVTVPALKGCVTFGKTLDHAKKMAEDAIKLYVECLQDEGEAVPVDRGQFLGQVSVKMQLA